MPISVSRKLIELDNREISITHETYQYKILRK